MRRCAGFGCVLTICTLLLLPQPAAAQAGGDIAIGYSALWNDSLALNTSTLPLGFNFDTSLRMSDFWSIAFDLNGHFRRGIDASDSREFVVPPDPNEDFQAFSFNRPETEFCSLVLSDCEVHAQSVGAVGGPRLHFPVGGGGEVFVHGMAGVTRSLRKIGFFAHTATHFAVQPGGGVDIPMTDNTAFRVQADYRHTFFPEPDQSDPSASLVSKDGEDYKDFTLTFGVVFKLGAERH